MMPENVKHFLLVIEKIEYKKKLSSYKDFIPIWLFTVLIGFGTLALKAWFVFGFNAVVSIGGLILWFLFSSRVDRCCITMLTGSNFMISAAGLYFKEQYKTVASELLPIFLALISFLVGIAFFYIAIKRDYYKEKSKKIVPIGAATTLTITFLAMSVSRLMIRNLSSDTMDRVLIIAMTLGIFISMLGVAMGWYVLYYSRKFK